MNLKVRDIESGYGLTSVIWDIDLDVQSGEIVAIIGSNGAGKTTTMKTIMGLLPSVKGKIFLDDIEITDLDTTDRVKKGMCIIPEGRQIFYNLTLEENLLMGAVLFKERSTIKSDLFTIYDFFPEIKNRKTQMGGTLSGGEQQMLAIGRGLMSHPKILLIDELSLGLAPLIVERLVEFLRAINRKQGISIVLVEQDVETALSLASRAYVMETGRIIASGKSEELYYNKKIREAYLGI